MTNNATFLADLLGLLVKEGRRRLLTLTVLFSVVAVAALGVGVMLPKRWESSTVLVAETDNILKNILEGRAVATGIADQTALVTQAVLSRRILREVLTFGGWTGRRSPQEEERLLNQLRSRIHIDSPRDEMLRISYNDSDPKRTYQIANKLAEIYLRESTVSKERESREAFDFISKQVKEYGDKLADAHEKVLAYYRSQESGTPVPVPVTGSSSSENEAAPKISADELALLRDEEATLIAQLGRNKRAVVAAPPRAESQEVEEQYRVRVVQTQAELDRLLATYTEEHPDVKRVRRALVAANEDLHRVEQARATREKAAMAAKDLDDDVTRAAQARLEEVQRRISGATNRRRPSSTSARVVVPDSKIDPELRGVGQDTTLSELLRRYEATRDVYQDLLKRRENARVSMELDVQHRGLTLRVQEAAEMPVTATSLRLMQISAIGLVLALAVPLGFLFVLVRFDPRVRSPSQIERLVRVPLLATIPYAPSSADRSRGRNRSLLVVVMLAGVFAVYAAVFLIKLKTST